MILKLKEYETQERMQKRWQPYREMEAELAHMNKCRRRLEDAAHYQDEAEEISREFGLDLQTYGRACIWDAHTNLEKQMGAKGKELMELDIRLTEEEE